MKKKKISILFIIIWLIIIFVLSSFTADESGRQSGFIVGIIMKICSGVNVRTLSMIVRNVAHFLEYFILGVLCSTLCKKKRDFWWVLVFCIIYAISDEVHQIFVKGRVFQILDIMIDSFGAFIGIVLCRLIFDKKG